MPQGRWVNGELVNAVYVVNQTSGGGGGGVNDLHEYNYIS